MLIELRCYQGNPPDQDLLGEKGYYKPKAYVFPPSRAVTDYESAGELLLKML